MYIYAIILIVPQGTERKGSEMKLQGYGLMVESKRGCTVEAMFKGSLEIVFEGMNKSECIRYCHQNGMKAIDKETFRNRSTPWFIKKNAKHPFNPDEWTIGTVY